MRQGRRDWAQNTKCEWGEWLEREQIHKAKESKKQEKKRLGKQGKKHGNSKMNIKRHSKMNDYEGVLECTDPFGMV